MLWRLSRRGGNRVEAGQERVLVVVSHYNAWPSDNLVRLLDQMRTIPAGWPFRVRVVVNAARPHRLSLPPWHADVEVCYRPNNGYNIGAWDEGWRLDPAYDAYLFIQEECRILRDDWLGAFVRKANEPRVGLVGESLSPVWDALWEELERRFQGERPPGHLVDGQPAERVPCYLDFLRRHGIDPGPRGDHLQSLVLFARRTVLEQIDGFPIGDNYGEAIASEIGMSKKIQALGLRLCEVGPHPFTYIEHPQWRYLLC
jgi:hypothetical protein